jgi:hypothetical protein
VSADVIGGGLAAVLTVMIFSYLLGANPLYRLAQHLFVGISIGYAGVVLLTTVLLPRLGQVGALLSSWLPGTAPVSNPGDVLLRVGVPMLLGVLFLGRVFRPNFPLATPALLVVTAVAAALALGGALAGTLVPQMAATMLSLNPAQVGVFGALNNAIIVLGVLVSLYYFSFGVRPDGRRGARPPPGGRRGSARSPTPWPNWVRSGSSAPGSPARWGCRPSTLSPTPWPCSSATPCSSGPRIATCADAPRPGRGGRMT